MEKNAKTIASIVSLLGVIGIGSMYADTAIDKLKNNPEIVEKLQTVMNLTANTDKDKGSEILFAESEADASNRSHKRHYKLCPEDDLSTPTEDICKTDKN
jgi:hypothetical protein